jgi:hypothetical protein
MTFVTTYAGDSMKIRALLTSSVLLAGLLTVVVPGTVNAAKKQTVKIFMTGDCADGQMVEGVDEDDCEITVSMTPKTAKRSAVLEVAYDADEPEWEELDAGSTRSGRLIFGVSSTDEDDYWMDGVVLYRVRVKKSGINKQMTSKEYKTAYTSADAAADDEDLLEDLATEDPEEQAFNEKMDSAKKDNQQKINQQQPNQDIKQNNNGGNKGQPQNNSGGNQPQFENKPPTPEQRAGEFNRACGSIQMSKDTCNKVIAAKNGAEAIAVLGPDSEKFCQALAKMACKDVMPFAFP